MNFGDPAHLAVFKLSSVSQRLAIWIERFSYLFVNLYILFGHRICYVTQFSILLQIKLELNMLSIRNADDPRKNFIKSSLSRFTTVSCSIDLVWPTDRIAYP